MSDLIDRAEVMKLLDEQCWNGMFTYFRGEHHVNCFRELVKAIPSIENKGDLISRQAVIDALTKTSGIRGDVLKALYDLPSVENKGEWIPVSSGELPKIGQRVLATIETYDDGLKVVDTMYDKRGFICGNALAWQPLPKPYKVER